MNWIDYREKLGIGFNDERKFTMMKNSIYTEIDNSDIPHIYGLQSYKKLCSYIGRIPEEIESYNNPYEEIKVGYIDLALKIINSSKNIKEYISLYIAFVNTFLDDDNGDDGGKQNKYALDIILNALKNFSIPFEIIETHDEYFIFPKGAKELDDALISDVLLWLNEYPKSKKTFTIALKQYSEGLYIRDVADNLRKALEEFFREFLGNNKQSKSNVNEIFKYLNDNDSSKKISPMLKTLLNLYFEMNNETAKHQNNAKEELLEFLVYQTGIFIRTLIVIKGK